LLPCSGRQRGLEEKEEVTYDVGGPPRFERLRPLYPFLKERAEIQRADPLYKEEQRGEYSEKNFHHQRGGSLLSKKNKKKGKKIGKKNQLNASRKRKNAHQKPLQRRKS